MDDCLVCRVCTPDSHPHRVTNTKCRIDAVISPDDGHIVTQNMLRKEINILRKIVHQVGFIYKMDIPVLLSKLLGLSAVFTINLTVPEQILNAQVL